MLIFASGFWALQGSDAADVFGPYAPVRAGECRNASHVFDAWNILLSHRQMMQMAFVWSRNQGCGYVAEAVTVVLR